MTRSDMLHYSITHIGKDQENALFQLGVACIITHIGLM
jgi:hypothetical protein